MKKGYLGVDIGSISTKAVIIDENNNILAEQYIWTEGSPINAVKNILTSLEQQLPKDVQVVSVGTTGSARELIGSMLNAQMVKNEITAHAMGTLSKYPNVSTILEIGGQDSKIILLENGLVTDYQMNTLCAAGTGSFLSSQSKRLGISIEDFGEFALRSKQAAKIAGRCTVFAESDLVHRLQAGAVKEDVAMGLCNAVVTNYINNVGKGKKIKSPVVFQGGVSKNIGVIKAFENALGCEVFVDEHSHLMGALGIAILAKNSKKEAVFEFDAKDVEFNTSTKECNICANNCEITCIAKEDILIDMWGNRCEAGPNKIRKEFSSAN